MPKLSEQIKKANVANIIKKAKSGKPLNNTEMAIVEEYDREQEIASQPADSRYNLSVKELMSFFGVSEMQISRWCKIGMPKEDKGVYNLKKCFDWWREVIVPPEAPEEKDARDRYWRAKADGEEIKVSKIKGELIAKVDVFGEFAARAANLKTSLRALKHRISAVVVGKEQDEIIDIIGRETDEMLRVFCRQGKYTPDDISVDSGAVSEAETVTNETEKPKAKKSPVKKTVKKSTTKKKAAKKK